MGFPSGYSNPMTFASRDSNDQFYRDMLQSAAARNNASMANTLNTAMGLANKQMTEQQMQTLMQAQQRMADMTGPLMLASPTTRYFEDAFSGGNSQRNTAFAMAGIRKQFRDPLSLTEHMSLGVADLMAEELHASFYGGDAAQNRAMNHGFRAGELPEIMKYMAQRGELGSPSSLRYDYSDPDIAAAAKRGNLTAEMLEKTGRHDIVELLGDDLSSEESKKLAAKQAGGRLADDLSRGTKALRAVKDLFEKSDIFLTTNEALQAMDRMTSRFGSQITQERIDQTLRTTGNVMRNMGLGAREQGVLMDVGVGIAEQHGYESAFGTELTQNAALQRYALIQSRAFETKAYGRMSADQATQMSMHADAAFGHSFKGKAIAVMERLRQRGFKATSPEMQKFFDDLENGTDSFSSDALDRMSPEEFQAFLAENVTDASGRQIGGAAVDNMLQDDFANDRQINNSRLSRYRTGVQRRDYYNQQFAYKAAETYGTRFEGQLSDQKGATGNFNALSEIAFDLATRHADDFIDRDTGEYNAAIQRTIADKQLNWLKEQAAAGNTTAQEMLQSLGETEEQRLNALSQTNQQVFDANGNIQNTLSMLSPEAQDNRRAAEAESEAAAWMESSLGGSSNATMAEGFLSMAESLEKQGQSPQATLYKAMGNLINDKNVKLTDEQIHQSVDPIYQAYQEYEAALDEAEKNGASEQTKQALAAKKAALGAQLEKFQKNFSGYEMEEQQKQAGAEGGGSAQAGGASGGPMELSMSGVTININGVEVGTNLTAEARGRRTEVPA